MGNTNRVLVVGSAERHAVELKVSPFYGFRCYVDGQRAQPKKSWKILERRQTIELRIGKEEEHSVLFDIQFLTRYSWECTIYVDGNEIRRFEDSAVTGMNSLEKTRFLASVLLAVGILIFVVSRFYR